MSNGVHPHEDPDLLIRICDWIVVEKKAGRNVDDGDVALAFSLTLAQAAKIRETFMEWLEEDEVARAAKA